MCKRSSLGNYETHSFYCMNCGMPGIPIPRKKSHKHSSFHRKKLYCLNCKTEVNHIECSSSDEIEIFKTSFERGEYRNEVQDSLAYLRSACVG